MQLAGDAPAGGTPEITVDGTGPSATPVRLLKSDPFDRWEEANVVRGIDRGTVTSSRTPGSATSRRPVPPPRRHPARLRLDIRITNRQNFALRDLTESDLRGLYDRLTEIGMAEPGAELAHDVVSCPGADTCTSLWRSHVASLHDGDALEDAGLAEVGGVV